MSPLRGILLMITAISLFVVMGSLVKAAVRIPAVAIGGIGTPRSIGSKTVSSGSRDGASRQETRR